jgi:putative transposase
VHSETQQTPLERFEQASAPALPTPALLREAFLWSQAWTVTNTAMVSLRSNHYEVDAALVGRHTASSVESFSSKSSAKRAAESVKASAASAPVVEE